VIGGHGCSLRRGYLEHLVGDHLKKPSCHTRALWDLVEEVVCLLKVFGLFQLHLLHHFLHDLSGFEVDFPDVVS